jgi:hypothetical protein
MNLLYFSLGWVAIIYFFNSAIAKRLKVIDFKIALLYISTVVLSGTFGEVFINSIYNFLFNVPLWEYKLFPIHNAYTSYYSMFIWSMYGFYLYLLHDNLKSNNYPVRTLAIIVSIEAIILEFLFNLSHLFIFKDYIFYYLPSDIWHLTSLQAIPFYFLAGFVIIKSIKRFKADPWFFIPMNILLVFTLVFLVS